MFNAFGDDPRFHKIMHDMFDNVVIKMNNDLKFNNKDLHDDVVTTTFYTLIHNENVFTVLRTINLVTNGSDAERMGNVNEFIDLLEEVYFEGKKELDEFGETKRKTYGGL